MTGNADYPECLRFCDRHSATAILRLHQEGLSNRATAKVCQKARGNLRAVLRSGGREEPEPGRPKEAGPWREEILR